MSNNYILTYSGKVFDLLDPKPEMICLDDIFQSLACLNRFTGHTRRPYSVLEHCVRGAGAMPTWEVAFDFLLHDAAEAYTGDMSSPLKALCPEYKVIQNRIDAVIQAKYCVKHPPCVKVMDLIMLATEKRDLMLDGGRQCSWVCLDGIDPLLGSIGPASHRSSRSYLVQQAHEMVCEFTDGRLKNND